MKKNIMLGAIIALSISSSSILSMRTTNDGEMGDTGMVFKARPPKPKILHRETDNMIYGGQVNEQAKNLQTKLDAVNQKLTDLFGSFQAWYSASSKKLSDLATDPKKSAELQEYVNTLKTELADWWKTHREKVQETVGTLRERIKKAFKQGYPRYKATRAYLNQEDAA